MESQVRYVLVDTDVTSYRFAKRPEFERFQGYLKGSIPAISFMTLGEALGGAWYAEWPAEKIAAYEAHLRSSYLLIPADRALAEARGRLYADCKRHGIGISEADLWIAATGLRYNIPLLTNDRNFRRVSGLVVLPPEEEAKADGNESWF